MFIDRKHYLAMGPLQKYSNHFFGGFSYSHWFPDSQTHIWPQWPELAPGQRQCLIHCWGFHTVEHNGLQTLCTQFMKVCWMNKYIYNQTIFSMRIYHPHQLRCFTNFQIMDIRYMSTSWSKALFYLIRTSYQQSLRTRTQCRMSCVTNNTCLAHWQGILVKIELSFDRPFTKFIENVSGVFFLRWW